ncbi:MAG: MBOAT family protein, partial [Clostridia bacterium]|nr:MBOAT family protein [Clostridia bacterium]
LGGNRVSMPRHLFNIFVVWLLTGLWHGAAWSFVVWGLYFAVLLIIEKLFLLKHLEKSKALSRAYTLFIVLISFVIFNATDMGEAFSYLKGMLFLGGAPVISAELSYCVKGYGVTLLLGAVGATPIVKKLVVKLREGDKSQGLFYVLRPVVLVSLLTVATAYLVDGSFNPFLYFRF